MAVAFVCNRALSIPGAGSAGPDPLCKGEVRAGVSKGRRQASAGPLASPVSSEVDLDVLRPLPCGWETRGRRRGGRLYQEENQNAPPPPACSRAYKEGSKKERDPLKVKGAVGGGGAPLSVWSLTLSFPSPPAPSCFPCSLLQIVNSRSQPSDLCRGNALQKAPRLDGAKWPCQECA